MTAFDRAWEIVKNEAFGDKFNAKLESLKEGAKGVPEKFEDLESTGSGDERPEMPEGEPINIFDLKNFRPSQTEIDNNAIVDAIMSDVKIPKSLIERTRKLSNTPQPDIETEEFEA